MYDIGFPHLGIFIQNLRNSINIGPKFSIAFYGMIIGAAIIIGMLIVYGEAKRTGQNPDIYTDFIIWGIIAGVVGARLYYVLFQLDYYMSNPAEIINLRSGGLAIYGAVIGAFIALAIFCKHKKQKPLIMLDTMVPCLVLGQAMGRWGNFFNMEAFGRYTDSLFAMQLRLEKVSPAMLGGDVLQHVITLNGVDYIQVTPTFLYESVGCFLIFIFLMILRKHKTFSGELLWFYVGLYGVLRAIIEGLRIDSLMIGKSGIRVSQLLAVLCAVAALVMLIRGFLRVKKNGPDPDIYKPEEKTAETTGTAEEASEATEESSEKAEEDQSETDINN